MTSSICEVELCKYPRSRSSCAVVPPWTWILWWARGAPQRTVSCGCQAAGHGCNLAHPVNGLMPLPSPPRAPVAIMRVSDAHSHDEIATSSHLPTAWRALYLLPGCSSGDETPAQAHVSSSSAQAQPPAGHSSRACVNSSRMSLCLASVWALASPVLVTVLLEAGRQQTAARARGQPCRLPCTRLLMASFTSDRRCSRASISSPLALTTCGALRQPHTLRGPGRRAGATPARRCPQRARFFRSLKGAGVSGNLSKRRIRSTHLASRSWPGGCRPRPPASVPGRRVSAGPRRSAQARQQAHLLAKHVPEPRGGATDSACRGCSRRKHAYCHKAQRGEALRQTTL